MAKIERKFLTDLRKSLIPHGVFFEKIPDLPHFEGAKFRFDRKKPFDAFACFFGHPIAIEAKYIPKHQAFGLKNLLPHQIEGLGKWALSGGYSWVFLIVKQKKDIVKNTVYLNKLYIFSFTELKAKGQYSKAELSILPAIDFKKGKYDLGPWLDGFLYNKYG